MVWLRAVMKMMEDPRRRNYCIRMNIVNSVRAYNAMKMTMESSRTVGYSGIQAYVTLSLVYYESYPLPKERYGRTLLLSAE